MSSVQNAPSANEGLGVSANGDGVVFYTETKAEKDQNRSGKASILGNRARPPVHEIDPIAIPDNLKRHDRWLGWNWSWNEERQKWDKPPINVRTGGFGSSTNPATWCSFDVALAAQREGRVHGIGFALGQADGVSFAGLDLDDCRDPATGELSLLAHEILGTMKTYAEVSPTRTGVKLICIGELPANSRTKNRQGTVEIYGRGRYFTLTGQRIDGAPELAEERREQLAEVWAKYIGEERSKPTSNTSKLSWTDNIANAAVCEIALSAMLRHKPNEEENDGSKRLFCVSCRAIDYDLSAKS